GLGLGLAFLRHASRTRILIHVVDIAATEDRDPISDYHIIRAELAAYDEALLERPHVVVANKMDQPEAATQLQRFREHLPDVEVWPISAVTREGIEGLLYRVAEVIEATPAVSVEEQVESGDALYLSRGKPISYSISQSNDVFVVESAELDKVVQMTNFEQYDGVRRFQRIMQRSGVDDALRQRGAKNGDQIQVGDMVFDFVE
ncbi:MAG: Obg family GTPase CgtA, partial [Firmicutes bacterium]|nr:Obg family GTPase CgtA [Bacillota bacterium]